MESQNKPLPPFGAVLAQYIKLGIPLKFAPYIFCGNQCWQQAKESIEAGQPALCLPSNTPPESFTWPVMGLRIIIYHTNGATALGLSKLAYVLLSQGARQVTIFDEATNALRIFNHK